MAQFSIVDCTVQQPSISTIVQNRDPDGFKKRENEYCRCEVTWVAAVRSKNMRLN